MKEILKNIKLGQIIGIYHFKDKLRVFIFTFL